MGWDTTVLYRRQLGIDAGELIRQEKILWMHLVVGGVIAGVEGYGAALTLEW
jgi:hypothetical protein